MGTLLGRRALLACPSRCQWQSYITICRPSSQKQQLPKKDNLAPQYTPNTTATSDTSAANTTSTTTTKMDTPLYQGHVRTSMLQRGLLALGSAAAALHDPYRHDMVAVLGETTGTAAASRMLGQMMSTDEGRAILRDKPRITSESLGLEALRTSPVGTFGRAYADFMVAHDITPDTRAPVRFVEDVQLAYVVQRYREVHDFWHALLGMPATLEGELAVKWFEAVHTRQPMCGLGAVFGPLRAPQETRRRVREIIVPWAIKVGSQCQPLMGLYYEHRLSQDLQELRDELGIPPPPTEELGM